MEDALFDMSQDELIIKETNAETLQLHSPEI